mgnify:CR=1 FL=1
MKYFDELTKYYVEIAATAFDDSGGNSYAGIDNSTNKLEFMVGDFTNPTLSSSSPLDGATEVNTLTSLVLNFSEVVDAESGNVVLYKSDGTEIETYDVTDTSVVIRGSSSTYSVDISADITTSTSYYIQIAAYAMAHDAYYGSEIKQGVIMVCTPDLYYQEFKVSGAELKKWKHKFLKRLDHYHELIFDEKERAKVDPNKLLKEFEEDEQN